jgi:hypothetical protein
MVRKEERSDCGIVAALIAAYWCIRGPGAVQPAVDQHDAISP